MVIPTIVAIRPPCPPVYDKGDADEKQRIFCTCKKKSDFRKVNRKVKKLHWKVKKSKLFSTPHQKVKIYLNYKQRWSEFLLFPFSGYIVLINVWHRIPAANIFRILKGGAGGNLTFLLFEMRKSKVCEPLKKNKVNFTFFNMFYFFEQ